MERGVGERRGGEEGWGSQCMRQDLVEMVKCFIIVVSHVCMFVVVLIKEHLV